MIALAYNILKIVVNINKFVVHNRSHACASFSIIYNILSIRDKNDVNGNEYNIVTHNTTLVVTQCNKNAGISTMKSLIKIHG
jgi:hypothetical protein